jgi:replicative DNA helicase
MAELSLGEFKILAAEVRRENRKYRFTYNRRTFEGAYYYERCFLSCLLAGAAIPKGITVDLFSIPRHRLIFEALRGLEALGIRNNTEALVTWLDKAGILEKARGEAYIQGIRFVINVPSAVTAFAVELRRLALARLPRG